MFSSEADLSYCVFISGVDFLKIAEFPKEIIKESVAYTTEKIEYIIKNFGPRESGNESCLKTQKLIESDLGKAADETHYESYKMAPKAFLMFTKFVSVLIIAAVVVLFSLCFSSVISLVTLDIILAVCIAVGLFITAMEFLFYKQFCDVFHKKVTGHNFVATRNPSGEIKRRIIISGHCDSAYEWRHIYYCKGIGMGIFMGSTIVSSIASFIVCIVRAALNASGVDNGFTTFLYYGGFALYSFMALSMITLLLFVNFRVISPGANDNLTGTFAAACALRMLDKADIRFENTQVVCMITDGEEAGLRGCKQFAKDHYDEYVNSGVETAVLCVDTLTDLEYLNVYNRDMTGTVRHSPDFSKLVMESAIEAGKDTLKYANVFFGSSDAAAFTQAGITATCLAAMDPTPADYYHNRRDSYDRLVPEAIETGYEIILSTIFNFDKKGLK